MAQLEIRRKSPPAKPEENKYEITKNFNSKKEEEEEEKGEEEKTKQ